MMVAYLVTGNDTIGLVQNGRRLEWRSETPGLAERATRLVPIESIPESGGNPASWAIEKLKSILTGTSCVIAGNVEPDRFYSRRV